VDRSRISLNNPAFDGRLRQSSRSLGYVRRPISRPQAIIQDIKLKPTASTLAPLNPVKVYKRPAQSVAGMPVTKQTVPPKLSAKPVRRARTNIVSRQPQKSAVLWRQAVQTPGHETPAPKARQAKKQPRKWQAQVLYTMAGVLFVVGVAVSLNGLRTNRQVAAQIKHVTSQNDGTNTSSAPSTARPTNTEVASYAVAPNLPKYIDIAKLSVHARIKSMSVNSQNQLQAPGNVYDAGWYNSSAQPGQPGAMLVDGHISSWTTNGVFYGLNKLVVGDPIVITRGDGKTFTYKVVKAEVDDAKSVDMASLLVSEDTAKPGLNLISCSGDVIPGTNEFDKRIVVYAVQS